jgi:hypothetical protein
MKRLFVLLVLLAIGCNQVSGVDDIHFSKEEEPPPPDEDGGADTAPVEKNKSEMKQATDTDM